MIFNPLRLPPARVLARGLLHHAASIAVAFVFVVPLVLVIAASLRQPGLPPPRTIELIPAPVTFQWAPAPIACREIVTVTARCTSPTLEVSPAPIAWGNYARIFRLVPLGRFILNSSIVVALAVPITLLTASWAGLAMAQLEAHIQRRLMLMAILLLLVPVTALWLTRFVLFRYLLLIDTTLALIVPAFMGSSPLFVLLFYWTFRRVPLELFESAFLDGAGALRIWRSIAMPLASPTIVAVAVLTFVLYWSDFIHPLLYLKSERLYTLPVGLRMLQQMDKTNWPLLMAGSVLMSAPVVGMFLLVQRYFWPEGRLTGLKH